jgi:hypothetical protein
MAAVTWKGTTTQLVEASNSPAYDAGDRASKTRVYHGLFSYCETVFGNFAKGTIGSGAEAGYVVEKSSLRKLRGGIGQITVEWVAATSGSGQPLPPDEVAVSATSQSPRLERHPNYASLTAEELQEVDNCLRMPDATARKNKIATLTTLPKELVNKILKGNESYYLATLRYSWVTHSYSLPTTTRGGYIDTISGPLAGYFVAGIVWLREADNLDNSNGVWRRTITWAGSDSWDADIY